MKHVQIFRNFQVTKSDTRVIAYNYFDRSGRVHMDKQ